MISTMFFTVTVRGYHCFIGDGGVNAWEMNYYECRRLDCSVIDIGLLINVNSAIGKPGIVYQVASISIRLVAEINGRIDQIC